MTLGQAVALLQTAESGTHRLPSPTLRWIALVLVVAAPVLILLAFAHARLLWVAVAARTGQWQVMKEPGRVSVPLWGDDGEVGVGVVDE